MRLVAAEERIITETARFPEIEWWRATSEAASGLDRMLSGWDQEFAPRRSGFYLELGRANRL